MKNLKKYLVVFLMLVTITPFVIKAEEAPIDNFVVEADDEVSSTKDVNGSGVYAGNNVTFDKKMDGIGLFAGNNVNFKGNSEYALIAGNNITVAGTISKDGAVLGNIINFDDNFIGQRDIVVLGAAINAKGQFNRDVIIYGDSVILEKVNIAGNVKIFASSIEIKKDTVINGTLSYNEDAKTNIASEATITNTILSAKIGQSALDRLKDYIVDYAGMLLVFLALVLIVPGLFKRIDDKTKDRSVASIFALLGFGAVGIIAVPIAFILLCSFIFGVSLGLLLLALYIIIMCLTTLFTGYFIGTLILRKCFKKENMLLSGLIGITAIYLLTLVPYISGFVSLINILFGFGIVIMLFKRD